MQQAQKTALRKYGTDTLSAVNETHTFVLFQQASKSRSNPYAKTHFFVYDLKRNEVIYEDSIPSASVRWHTAQSLLISRQKGIIQDTEDDGKIRYIYDLNTKKTKEVSPNTQNEKI
ncbi:MAG: hypothetical protein CSB06_01580 [Bacteroidia bacterium]|nr:MAG: hypothetical protein CSB06_01580 [Bacteroidia bacterium]